jgi:outer membrane protein assembly factor BamA
MRGYDYNALLNRCRAGIETSPGASSACDVLNQMFGQRLIVTNLELRFPLVQALVLGGGIGVPPIEGFLFTDAGVMWGQEQTPVFATGVQASENERGILTSAGIGGRVNLFGYAILEASYARAMVGDLGWRWQFALQPGF